MMKYQSKLKTSYAISIGLSFVCTVILGVSAPSSFSGKGYQATVLSMQRPSVSIEAQVASPLRIVGVNTDSLTANTPEVELTLTNLSKYPISAYAVRFDVLGENWQKGGVDLSDAVSVQSIFKPGQSKPVTVGGGIRYSDPIKAVKLAIDFVEFTHGLTWGPDSFQSSERLDGRRAGVRALALHLRQILQEKGPAAALASGETEETDVLPGPNHSAQWSEGFQAGTSVMRSRIKEGYSRAGLAGLQTTLT